MNYILFTPVGTTDPISDQHDKRYFAHLPQYKPKCTCICQRDAGASIGQPLETIEKIGQAALTTFEVECIARLTY